MSLLSDTINSASFLNDTVQKNGGYMMNDDSVMKDIRSPDKGSLSFRRSAKLSYDNSSDTKNYIRGDPKGLST